MKLISALLLSAACLPACAAARDCARSPGQVIEVCVAVENGRALFDVSRDGVSVLERSTLGLEFGGETPVRYRKLSTVKRQSVDTTWEQPWGEQRLVRDNHTELTFVLEGNTAYSRHVGVTFRLFDEGIGLRYSYTDIPAGKAVDVIADNTSFQTVGDYDAWWYPALGPDRDEYLYEETDAKRITLAETPLTLEGENGLYLSFHEAALVDFPSMLLQGNGAGRLQAWLMPWPDGVLAHKTGPFTTPWRTVLITDDLGTLADSRMELNLNEPNKLGDVSWFKPGKYIGIWWEMHLNKSTWGSGPTHGATTENTKRYIDFAAANGFDGVLVEGWNEGWDGDWVANGDKFSFTRPYPDFDLDEVTRYAEENGVYVIGHHETGGAVENYAAQLEAGLDLYKDKGVSVIKSGYVRPSGDIPSPEGGQWFAGQYMVRHHLKVVEEAAKRQIAINAHEPVKDTGLRRTWPNWVSREGARGQEFNAWGRPTNPPQHRSILPFTRLLAGPMDFTPGIFDIEHGQEQLDHRVQSTLAAQLAEYVVFYSPVQMAADLPENYEARPDAFQFIKDVVADWEVSKTLQGAIGDYAVVARQARGAGDWFLGAVTDEEAREVAQPLDFLTPGKTYQAQIYKDAPEADYRTNPTALVVETVEVTSGDVLSLAMAPGGGIAIRFVAQD